MHIDPRFSLEYGREVFTGTQLLLKGALEAVGSIHLLAGVSAPPVTGFLDACELVGPLLRGRSIVVRRSHHESEAIAAVQGAVLAGGRAMAVLSGAGLQAAAEPVRQAIRAGLRPDGAALIVVADDTWSDSGCEVDSRPLLEHLHIPIVEPCDPQEVKDWTAAALKLSTASGTCMGLRLTGELAHGGGSVEVNPNHAPAAVGSHIAPPVHMTEALRQRCRNTAMAGARHAGINRVDHKPHKGERAPLGFVAAGAAYAPLVQALEEMGLGGRLPILKLGMIWPIDTELLRDFALQVSQVVVVEAGQPFVQSHVTGILTPLIQEQWIDAQVWGKTFPGNLPGIPSSAILHPSHLIERLAGLLKELPTAPVEWTNGRLDSELRRIAHAASVRLDAVVRHPTFCPGCPQRDTSAVLVELARDLGDPAYMQRVHRRRPVELIVHGDGGCTSLTAEPPYAGLVRSVSAPGQGGIVAGAVGRWGERKQVVLMGDDTFFRTGRSTLHQALAERQDVTYLLTVSQPHRPAGQHGREQPDPAAADHHPPLVTRIQEVERTIRQMTGHRRLEGVRIVRMNPEDRPEFRDALEQAVLAAGVKVVLADKGCALEEPPVAEPHRTTANTLSRQQTFMRIVEEVCDHCLECTRQTGCSALTVAETDYGPKIQTQPGTCVDDGACARTQVCPSFERITVIRTQAPVLPHAAFDVRAIPDPPRPCHADQDVWRCAVAGVGGLGTRTLTQILVLAGREMGYHVYFTTRPGRAHRGDSVFSQAVFTRDSRRAAAGFIPHGKADLLIALDPLEGARAVDGAGPYRVACPDVTAGVINEAVIPASESLLSGRPHDAPTLTAAVLRRLRTGRSFTTDATRAADSLLGHGRHANIVLLGAAFQLGYLPVTPEAIERSIRSVLRHDIHGNLRAFRLGRALVAEPERLGHPTRRGRSTPGQTIHRKRSELVAHFGQSRGRRFGREYLSLIRQVRREIPAARGAGDLVSDLAIRAADCIIWSGGVDYARRYVRRVLAIASKDGPPGHRAVTRTVVWNLARLMLIKDEVYVSRLLSGQTKRLRDQELYRVDPGRGDRIIYHRYHRPQLSIFGLRHTFAWRSRDWQLRLLAGCRWLRALPGWNKRDRRFLEWYEKLVDSAEWTTERQYQKWLAALSAPEQVTGFRDIRWPRIDAARRAAEAALAAPDDEQPPPQPRIRISLSDRVLTGSRITSGTLDVPVGRH